ncbi:MAG: MerR family transcriptional regulator [Telluria sp.]|nr:MerR family transcriptional regulator [Telluria sp.]
MRISELALRTGVSAHALRHYERLGLLQPDRTAGGYRDYAESARREVVFIAMSRKIGFSLKAIAQHLPAYRAGQLGFDDMILAMQRRVAEIDREVATLRAQRQQVVDHVRWLREQKALRKRAASRRAPAAKPWPARG